MIFDGGEPSPISVPFDDTAAKKGDKKKRDEKLRPEKDMESRSEESPASRKGLGKGMKRGGKGKSRRSL